MTAPGILRVAAVLLLSSGTARAAVDRYAVLVGNNQGARDEARLRFAETDAGKLQDVLEDVGDFPPENVVVLRSQGAARVRGAIIATNDRARASLSAGRQALLLVYYSGHADAEALHLGDELLSLRELEQLVRGSAANMRLLVVDACRSGALTQKKGATRAPPFPIEIEQRLAGEGAVFLTSSAINEEAQESDAIGGSFFTHYLVSALLGAADENGDGQVSLDEAYRFAYESTLRASSRTLVGLQHPTFRYELRGQGSTILTTPFATDRRGQVSFPRGLTFLLTRTSSEGPVVAEVGAHDNPRRLSVRPDRYFVRGRGRDYLLEGTITVGAGSALVLEERQLERVQYARLARKGGAAPASLSLELGYQGRTSLWPDGSPCNGALGGAGLALASLTLTTRLGWCRSSARRPMFTATHDTFDLQLGAWHEWDLRHLTVGLGAHAAAALVHQHFQTSGQAPARWVTAGELGAAARLVVPLSRRTFALGELGAATVLLRRDQPAEGPARIDAVAAGRAVLGLGLHH